MAAPETRSLMLPDGRRLAWCRVGDDAGIPVMHCHGGLSCRLEIGFADTLCRRLGVSWIVADRPGIGLSAPGAGRALMDWPADLAALADHLGIGRFAVTGWSAGGPYALACAAALADRVTGVATIAGMAPLRGRGDIRALGMATDRLLFSLGPGYPALCRAMLALTRAAPTAVVRTAIRWMLAGGVDYPALPPGSLVDVADSFIESLSQGAAGTVSDYRLLGSDWGFSFRDVRAPVTVWHGKADDLLPCEHAERLAAAIPGAGLNVLEGAGHFLPQRFATDILAALTGNGAGRDGLGTGGTSA